LHYRDNSTRFFTSEFFPMNRPNSTAENVPKIAELELSSCGLEVADFRKNCNCGVAVAEHIYLKVAELRLRKCFLQVAELRLRTQKKVARAHLRSAYDISTHGPITSDSIIQGVFFLTVPVQMIPPYMVSLHTVPLHIIPPHVISLLTGPLQMIPPHMVSLLTVPPHVISLLTGPLQMIPPHMDSPALVHVTLATGV
jgi:hypothetical protein